MEATDQILVKFFVNCNHDISGTRNCERNLYRKCERILVVCGMPIKLKIAVAS